MGFIRKYFLLLVMALFTIVFTYVNSGTRYEILPLTLFFLIGLFSLYGLFLSIDNHDVSLNKTFCLFYYFFFSIAPISQFKKNLVFFVKNKFISDELYTKGAILLLGILIIYLLLYHLIYSYFNKIKLSSQTTKQGEFKLVNQKLLVAISAISVVFYLYLIKFNWNLLIFRPFVFLLKNNTNLGLIGYAILLVVQIIPFVCLVRYKLRKPVNDKITYVLFFMMLLACFPTALSRSIVGMLYIPLFLLFMPILNKNKYYLKMYLVGLLVVFPLFNNFRYLYEGNFHFNYDLFESAHFDAFQNFVFLLDENIITNGRQLLGSVFFFVQESQWNNRPMGTGTLLAETLAYCYTNVDMPFFGEGYANFGYFGMFVFLILITFFNVFMDYRYARGMMSYFLKIFFYLFLGFEFYLLRGDLYSSVKIMTSFTLAIGIVESIFFMNKRWRVINV